MFEKENVVVIWLCKTLTKKFHKQYLVKVSSDYFDKSGTFVHGAVFNGDYGILCDCGHWTFGDDACHIPIRKNFRDVYYNDSTTDGIINLDDLNYTKETKSQEDKFIISFETEFDRINFPFCYKKVILKKE